MMAMESDANPLDALLAFFEGLPATIKGNITALVLVYAFRESKLEAKTDLNALLKSNLDWPFSMRTIGAILSTIAATDYVLDHFNLNVTKHRMQISHAAQELSDLEKTRLGFDLRQKHYEQARRDFDLLKQNSLNFRMLQDFENNLQRQQMDK
jgi:hypothetical protein